MSNILKEDIKASEGREKYDAIVKSTLSNKEILARILKCVVPEYERYETDYIRDNCIENVEVSKHAVHPNTASSKITGEQTESSFIDEGVFRFDIIFSAYLPFEKTKIKLVINLEIQNKSNPGYALVTRGLYYCSRLISQQYGREFEKSEYDNIKKVYSIWIVCNPTKSESESIVKYNISENVVYGSSNFTKNNYDKLEVVMLYLSKDMDNDEVPYIIGMLDTLLMGEKEADWRIETLENKFGIAMNDNDRNEVINMCNLSEVVYERGEKQGFERGKEQGYDEIEEAVDLYKAGCNSYEKLMSEGIDENVAKRVIRMMR